MHTEEKRKTASRKSAKEDARERARMAVCGFLFKREDDNMSHITEENETMEEQTKSLYFLYLDASN